MAVAPHPAADPACDDRTLRLVEALCAIRAPQLEEFLEAATARVGAALGADLVDVFLYRHAITSLVAVGTGATPMARRARVLGLDRLPLVTGGCAVRTLRTGVPHLTGRADRDPDELRGLVLGLEVRSAATVALEVGGKRCGILLVASARPDVFDERDLRVLGVVAGWAALAMERARLAERLAGATERVRLAERRGAARASEELARLTPRQRSVAALVAEGCTTAEIARRLGLTEGTAANHVDQATKRLEFRSRVQLALWAYRHGLYRPDGDGDAAADPGESPPTDDASIEQQAQGDTRGDPAGRVASGQHQEAAARWDRQRRDGITIIAVGKEEAETEEATVGWA